MADETVKSTPVSRYENKVLIRGKISKIVPGKKATVVTIETHAAITVANYPTIVFFGDAAEAAAQFKDKQRVVIGAILQSYDEKTLRKGQSQYLIVGQTIAEDTEVKTTQEIELKSVDIPGHTDENRIDIRGQILAIECNKTGDVILTIRIITAGRWSIIKFPYYARNREKFLQNVHVHQFVQAVGTVMTANVPREDAIEETTVKSDNKDKTSTSRSFSAQRSRTRKVQYFVLYDIFATEIK